MVLVLSIEVDDVEAIYRRALAANLKTVYDLTDEPWGVRRFYLRDPLGRLVNILSHPVPHRQRKRLVDACGRSAA
jgi:uncharacterized glyoxalase superfamily protein PhnB